VIDVLPDRSAAAVAITDAIFGDPAPGTKKHFAAVVTPQGPQVHYACAEGQTVDFGIGGGWNYYVTGYPLAQSTGSSSPPC